MRAADPSPVGAPERGKAGELRYGACATAAAKAAFIGWVRASSRTRSPSPKPAHHLAAQSTLRLRYRSRAARPSRARPSTRGSASVVAEHARRTAAQGLAGAATELEGRDIRPSERPRRTNRFPLSRLIGLHCSGRTEAALVIRGIE